LAIARRHPRWPTASSRRPSSDASWSRRSHDCSSPPPLERLTMAKSPDSGERTVLQASEQIALLKSILESSTEYSIIAKDLKGMIVAWNEGARRVYGYDAADVVGRMHAFELHDREDVSSGKAQAILDEVLAKGK